MGTAIAVQRGELLSIPAGGHVMLATFLFSLFLATSAATPSAGPRDPQWIATGPEGGNVRALAADPTDPRRVFLGTPDGMLYRSEDGGRHWRRTSPGFPWRGCSLDDIAVDREGTLYVGWWEVDGAGGGVARSEDGGDTFTMLKGLDPQAVRALAIAPSDPRRIAAGTPTGVWMTRDAGNTWAHVTETPELHDVESLAFDALDPRILYAGTRHLAWKTIDGGASWQPIHTGMITDSHVMTLNVSARRPDDLFATACTGVYHSLDGGGSWKRLGGIPDSSRRTRSFTRSTGNDDLLIAGTTEGLWISEDGGARWRHTTEASMVVNAVLLEPDGTLLLGTEEEGVLRSTDLGRTWLWSNAGFGERFVSDLLFDGPRVYAGILGARPHGGVFVAPGANGPWRRLGAGLEGRQVMALAPGGRDRVFAGTDDGLFVRAGNDDWTRVDGAPRGPVHDLATLPSGRVLAATTKGIWLGLDRGTRWVPANLDDAGEALAVAAWPANPHTVVAATTRGWFRSEDGGEVWTQVSPPLTATPHALVFLPGDQPVLLATSTQGLLRSLDRGAKWEVIGGGLPHSDLSGIAAQRDGRAVFVSDFVHGGIFVSRDAGTTWQRVSTDGLASDHVWTLALDPDRPDRLIASARSGGLASWALPPFAAATPAAPIDGRDRDRRGEPTLALPAVNTTLRGSNDDHRP